MIDLLEGSAVVMQTGWHREWNQKRSLWRRAEVMSSLDNGFALGTENLSKNDVSVWMYFFYKKKGGLTAKTEKIANMFFCYKRPAQTVVQERPHDNRFSIECLKIFAFFFFLKHTQWAQLIINECELIIIVLSRFFPMLLFVIYVLVMWILILNETFVLLVWLNASVVIWFWLQLITFFLCGTVQHNKPFPFFIYFLHCKVATLFIMF